MINLISCRFARHVRREEGWGLVGPGLCDRKGSEFQHIKDQNDSTKREPGISKK